MARLPKYVRRWITSRSEVGIRQPVLRIIRILFEHNVNNSRPIPIDKWYFFFFLYLIEKLLACLFHYYRRREIRENFSTD